MADDKTLKVTLSADVSNSAATIYGQFAEIEKALSSKGNLKIVGQLDVAQTTAKMQEQLNSIKNLTVNVTGNTSGVQQAISNVSKEVSNAANGVSVGDKVFNAEDLKAKGLKYFRVSKDILSQVNNYYKKNGALTVDFTSDNKTIGEFNDKIESFTAKVKNATGVVQTFNYERAKYETASGNEYWGFIQNENSTTTDTSFGSALEKSLSQLSDYQIKLSNLLTKVNSSTKLPTAENQTYFESFKTQYSELEQIIKKYQEQNHVLTTEETNDLKVRLAALQNFVTQANSELSVKVLDSTGVTDGIAKITAGLNSFELKMVQNGTYTDELRNKVAALRQELSNVNTAQGVSELRQDLAVLNSQGGFERAAQNLETMNIRYRALVSNIQAYLAENTKIASSNALSSSGNTIAQEFNNLQEAAQRGDSSVAQLNARFSALKAEANAAGITGVSALDAIKEKALKFTSWMSIATFFMKLTSYVRSAIEELKEVDTILVEISKTSDRTADSLKELGENAFDAASKYGQTASDYLTGVQEMSRAGFGEDESEQMAELSILAQAAGDMTADLANEYLIATNAAYSLGGSVESLNSVLDSQNYITNRNALDMEELAGATKTVASQAVTSGVGIDEMTAAVGTMIATTQQGGETAARAFKAILMNLQQVSATADEIGDGESDIDEDSLTKYEKACNALGVSLTEVKDGVTALRDPMEILNELSAAFNKESEDSIKRANLISAIGGKTRGNQLAALLTNWNTYEKMLSEYNSTAAEGSAYEEAMKSADSWEGRLNSLSNTWTKFVDNFVDTDKVKDVISLLENAINVVDGLINGISSLTKISDDFSGFSVLASAAYTLSSMKDSKSFGQRIVNSSSLGQYLSKIAYGTSATIPTQQALSFSNNFNSVNISSLVGNFKELGSEIDLASTQWQTFIGNVRTQCPQAESYFKNLAGTGREATADTTALYSSMMGNANGIKGIKNAIATYNNAIGSVGTTQEDITRAISGTNASLGTYLTGLNGAKASLTQYIWSLIQQKAAAIGLQVAYTALNAAISLGISVAMSVIITLADKLIVTQEELEQSVDNLKDKYETLTNTISGLSDSKEEIADEFTELSEGVSANGENVSLTADEYARYKEICNQIADDLPNMVAYYKDMNNAVLTLKGSVEELNAAYEEQQQAEYQAYISENREDAENAIKDFSNKTGEAGFFAELFGNEGDYNLDGQIESIEALLTNGVELYNDLRELNSNEGAFRDTQTENALNKLNNTIDDIANKYGYTRDEADELWDNLNTVMGNYGIENLDIIQNFSATATQLQAARTDLKTELDTTYSVIRDYTVAAAYATDEYWNNLDTSQRNLALAIINGLSYDDITEDFNPTAYATGIIEKVAEASGKILAIQEELQNTSFDGLSITEQKALLDKVNSDLETLQDYYGTDSDNLKIYLGLDFDEDSINTLYKRYNNIVAQAAGKFRTGKSTIKLTFSELGVDTLEEVNTFAKMVEMYGSLTEAITAYKRIMSTKTTVEIISDEDLEEMHDAIAEATEDFNSNRSTLADAFEEMSEYGQLTADTIQDVIDAGYGEALSIDSVTGAVTLSAGKYERLNKLKKESVLLDIESEKQSLTEAIEIKQAALEDLAISLSKVNDEQERYNLLQDFNSEQKDLDNYLSKLAEINAYKQSLDAEFDYDTDTDTDTDNDDTPQRVTDFENEVKRKEHEIAMGRLEENQEYYDWLIEAARTAYDGLEDYQDELWDYEEKYYDWCKEQETELFEKRIENLEKYADDALDKYKTEDGSDLTVIESYTYAREQLNTAIAETQQRITDLNNSGRLDITDEVEDLEDTLESLNEKLEEIKDSEIESEREYIETIKDEYSEMMEDRISYIEEYQESLDETYDKQIDNIEKQISAIEEQISALEDKNEQEQRNNDILEARQNLAKAKATYAITYGTSGQISLKQDDEAVGEAQEELDELLAEQEIANLEQQTQALEDMKSALETEQDNAKEYYDKVIENLEKEQENKEEYYDSVIAILEGSTSDKTQSESNSAVYDYTDELAGGYNSLTETQKKTANENGAAEDVKNGTVNTNIAKSNATLSSSLDKNTAAVKNNTLTAENNADTLETNTDTLSANTATISNAATTGTTGAAVNTNFGLSDFDKTRTDSGLTNFTTTMHGMYTDGNGNYYIGSKYNMETGQLEASQVVKAATKESAEKKMSEEKLQSVMGNMMSLLSSLGGTVLNNIPTAVSAFQATNSAVKNSVGLASNGINSLLPTGYSPTVNITVNGGADERTVTAMQGLVEKEIVSAFSTLAKQIERT